MGASTFAEKREERKKHMSCAFERGKENVFQKARITA